jgi:hypothetical protein
VRTTVNTPQRGACLGETGGSRSALVRFEDVQRLKRFPTDGADFRFHDSHPELEDGAEGCMEVIPFERGADPQDGGRRIPYAIELRKDRTRAHPRDGVLRRARRTIVMLQQS